MNQNERVEILEKAKVFFKDEIISRHINNTKKLSDPKNFNVNPFTQKYLSQFAFGDVTPKSIAKTMIYPRALGTSIATTFGNQLQLFCNRVLGSYASAVSGMDIEFIDAIDGRKKYCQIKSGPTTINFDDVETIKKHFDGVFNLARRNGLNIQMTDCVVGVFYGSRKELSSFLFILNTLFSLYSKVIFKSKSSTSFLDI